VTFGGGAGDVAAITVDVEWAPPQVLAEMVARLDERGLPATFFCTHPGIEVPGHERALHPNFRRHGNSLLETPRGASAARGSDRDFYRFVVEATRAFCPEAAGVRAHSLFFDTDLLAAYAESGLRYDSSYFLPLAPGLTPVRKHPRIVELPLFYMDHWDLMEGATGFELGPLLPPGGGLRIFAFHPHLVFLNAASPAHYESCRPHYHDVDRLRKLVRPGRGAGTLFLELLDRLAGGCATTLTLGEIEERWRAGGLQGSLACD
jgi:hypothetical protein